MTETRKVYNDEGIKRLIVAINGPAYRGGSKRKEPAKKTVCDRYTCKKCGTSIHIPVDLQYKGNVSCPVCQTSISKDPVKGSRSGIYANLFNEGKTLNEIAEAVNAKPYVVRDVLIDCYVFGTYDVDISRLIVHPEYTEKINEILKTEEFHGSRAIRSELNKQGIKCDYDTIAVVEAVYVVEHRDEKKRRYEERTKKYEESNRPFYIGF